jgi:hypothetical protein
MIFLKILSIIALISLSFIFLNKSKANSEVSYVIDKDKHECKFISGNQKILLAGPEEGTYFFFPCFHFESKYEAKTPKKYFVSELLLAPTPRENAIYVRAIEMLNNKKFKDDKDLSYLLGLCIPLKKGGNEQLISTILKNKENYKKLCDMESGYLTLDKKTFFYDRKNNQFSIRKSYLIKGDKVAVSDYFFEKNILWLFVSYNDSTKKWIQYKI